MGEFVLKYRVEVRGQYKGAIAHKRGAASPWRWHKVRQKLDGTFEETGAVESFRYFAEVAPWIARVCRAAVYNVRFLTRAEYMRRTSRRA